MSRFPPTGEEMSALSVSSVPAVVSAHFMIKCDLSLAYLCNTATSVIPIRHIGLATALVHFTNETEPVENCTNDFWIQLRLFLPK